MQLLISGANEIPGFALELKIARQFSIEALPLWPAFGGHPDDLGELLPQTPSGSSQFIFKTKRAAGKGDLFVSSEAEGARTLNLRIDSLILPLT